MTGPHSETSEDPGARPISVAELLARNGTVGAPAVTRRRRRRRGDTDSITVAELTGEIPVVRDAPHDQTDQLEPVTHDHPANGGVKLAAPAFESSPAPAADDIDAGTPEDRQDHSQPAYWSAPEPRWPRSSPQVRRAAGPERSEYPRPLHRTDDVDAEHRGDGAGEAGAKSGAEHMSPDPMDPYADIPVDVMDSEVREAEPAAEDSAYVRSFLQASEGTLFGGQTLADELARRRSDKQLQPDPASDSASVAAGPATELDDQDRLHVEADELAPPTHARRLPTAIQAVWRGIVIVLQSVLAVIFGAGLFVAFDQLWRWNSMVALILSVLVILGLVVGVRVVRKTEDIASTLIAVAVGALITLGPLALLQSG